MIRSSLVEFPPYLFVRVIIQYMIFSLASDHSANNFPLSPRLVYPNTRVLPPLCEWNNPDKSATNPHLLRLYDINRAEQILKADSREMDSWNFWILPQRLWFQSPCEGMESPSKAGWGNLHACSVSWMWRERSCHWLNGILSLPVQYDLPRQPRSSVVYTTYSVVIQAMGCPLIAASISHTIQCTQVKKQWNELCVDGTIQSSEASCNPDRFIIFLYRCF